ncbi:calponin domain protein [Zymoseptoria brevis]|uniref:Calponin domain protein n=1 Tax=Zymoseptoria brevis TaxID=1047168 RepID=A0A0F4GZQ8_9PEZI|nr:calponin domain protein [Zymoseptoria brevis]
MASVTSLDADMRNLRLSRYTPHAANEARAWIEGVLGFSLPPGDLLEVLKDGVALCKLANLATQEHRGPIKFKSSKMPFVQMENISHFLKACELPPLNMPAHDRFLTVDLFEQKDPAQVLQCLSAFSRQANNINPSKIPSVIGTKRALSTMSPTATGGGLDYTNGNSTRRAPSPTKFSAAMPPSTTRPMSPTYTGGSNASSRTEGGSAKSPTGPVSSWSRRSDENNTAPAWNIHQYGYMGGASQGNQGISFGARRQITSQVPAVPSLAEKEKQRKEKDAEAQKLRQGQDEEDQRKRRAAEEEEDRAKLAEEHKWEEETRRHRDEERRRMEEQKRAWEDQERKWNQEEEARRREDAALQATLTKKKPPAKPRVPSSSILRGQTLADYQEEQAALLKANEPAETPEQRRVRELEKQLEEARERERQYQSEREERIRKGDDSDRSRPTTANDTDGDRPSSAHESDVSWVGDEREYSRHQWQSNSSRDIAPSRSSQAQAQAQVGSTRPLPSEPQPAPSLPQRSQPESTPAAPRAQPFSTPSPFSRPLPNPSKQAAPEPHLPVERTPNRTDAFLSSNATPTTQRPRVSSSQEAGDTSIEQSQLRDSRMQSQQATKAGAWASKSLLEREMERERERQKEWEAAQSAAKTAPRDLSQGTGEGQSWDVNQYGYMGGDSMNKGSSVGSGINIGGRRQIIGPRPKP